jgi:hypothetical protein
VEIEDSAETEESAGKKFEKIPLRGFFHFCLKFAAVLVVKPTKLPYV